MSEVLTHALPEGFVLNLTERAAQEVQKFIAAEPNPAPTTGLRVSVMPGGCSGFKYSLNIEDAPAEDDMLADINGVRVFVDAFSAQYLSGVTIDYTSSKAPAPGVAITPPVGIQWQKSSKYPLEAVVVDNTLLPDAKITGDLLPTFK